MVRIQPLRLWLWLWLSLSLSPLCRFVTTWTFETQGQTLLAVESIDAFMVIPPAFTSEHDVNSAVVIVDPGFADLPDTQA
jgi:hypothetical protein